MRWTQKISLRFRSLLRRKRVEQELGDELRFHLERLIEEAVARGKSPQKARYAALRELGGLEQIKEECRDMRRINFVETLIQDIRYGLRQMRRSPGFTIAAVLTLALGIGANTAIFSVVDAVVLRPLPFPQPDRLMAAGLMNPRDPQAHTPYGVLDYRTAHDRQHAFASFAGLAEGEGAFTYTGGAEPIRAHGTAATAAFFSVLGVQPILGRAFSPDADVPGHDREIVLSHSFWARHFGADPGALGRSMVLDSETYTIVGVMPSDFHFGWHNNDELWPVLQVQPRNVRYPYWILPIGRLKPGLTPAEATADLSAIARDVQRQFPQSDLSAATVEPLKTRIVGEVRLPLLILFGAVGLVLLIATVNVANLEVARSTARHREMAIRAALGAGRSRITRQVLTESLLVAGSGGLLGLFMAYWGVNALLALAPGEMPRISEVAVDGQVLMFTAAVSLLCGVLFGLAPSLHGLGRRLDETLRGGSQNLAEQRSGRGLRSALVAVEVSLSLVLLIGAGLLLRSFDRLSNTSPGFNPQPLLSTVISLPPSRYPDNGHVVSFYDRLLDRVQSLPGVAAAGISMSLPPDLLNMRNPFWVPTQPVVPGTSLPLAVELTVSSSYFRTLAVPLLRGRLFDDSDRGRSDPILIINDAMARRYYPGQNPVGQRIKTGDPNPQAPWETIVGVVGDVKYSGLDGPPEPTLYVPYFQNYWPAFSREMFLVVRASDDPRSVSSSLRAAVRGLDRDMPIDLHTMNDLLAESVAQPRFRTLLLGLFAGMALILAAVGIFGVMAYGVSRRTQEIGVRMALGASRREVLRMVLVEGSRVVLVGIGIGLAEAFAVSRLIRSLLFGVQPSDPITFVGVPLLVMLVALLACYIPARRATKIDPLAALRYE
ncbi:MAG TPA: ABC transporter permease [Terriglobia bacterium]|nr:ABC transporter permease [Terriglobia bacterium]